MKISCCPSRGKKKCPSCLKYVGVRTFICICGYSFVHDSIVDNIFCGSSLHLLKTKVPDGCVNLTICSPPYFHQRKYTNDDKEIGREASIEQYLDDLLLVFKECVRVTKNNGSIIFNIGDKYIDSSLMLIPYRFAWMACQQMGVMLINNITWVKTNPIPRQCTRRLVGGTEPFFHFVKSKDYYYNLDSLNVKKKICPNADSKVGKKYFNLIEQSQLTSDQKASAIKELNEVIEEVKAGKLHSLRMKIMGMHALPFGGQEGGRYTQLLTKGYTIIKVPGNKMHKDVIRCPVENIKGVQHPAIYPKKIIRRLIKLTTKEEDLVLDPFIGSGTTAIACKELNRHYIGFDLCQDFVNYAKERLKCI